MNFLTKLYSRTPIAAGVAAGVAAVMVSAATASAASFSNPGAAVSAGAIPFKIVCNFTDYSNDGAHSAWAKKRILSPHQTFSFTGKHVQSGDGALRGYVHHASDSRIAWRMETGKTGSPVYRFTQLRGSNEIIANVTLGGPTGAGGKATVASNPGIGSYSYKPENNPGPDSASVSVHTNPSAGTIRSPMSNIKGRCS